MEEISKEISTTRVGVKFGLYTGIASIIYAFLLNILNLNNDEVLGVLGIVIPVAGIYYGMFDFKKNNEGYIAFGQGLGLGLIVSAISGILSGFFNVIYFSMNPEMLQKAKEDAIKMYEDQGMSDEQIEIIIPWLDLLVSPGVMFLGAVIGTLFLGLIISLVIAAILKREKPIFD